MGDTVDAVGEMDEVRAEYGTGGRGFPAGRWRASWVWAAPAPSGSDERAADRLRSEPAARTVAVFRHSFVLPAVGAVADGPSDPIAPDDPPADRPAAVARPETARSLPATVGSPDIAPARLVATGRARWWINGHEVGIGPVRANPARSVWDDADVAALLRPGRNELAVLVVHEAGATAWHMPAPPVSDITRGALAFELDLGPAVPQRWIVSDASWRGRLLDGWTTGPASGIGRRGRELTDARRLPDGWEVDPATGATLDPVIVRRATSFGSSGRRTPPSYPYGTVAGRPISRPTPRRVHLERLESEPIESQPIESQPMESEPTESQPVEPDAPSLFRTPAEVGVVAGELLLDVDGPAGSELLVEVAERLDPSTGLPAPGEHDASWRLVLDGSRRTISSLDTYGLQGVRISVPGPDGITAPVADRAVVYEVAVVERLHPVLAPAQREADRSEDPAGSDEADISYAGADAPTDGGHRFECSDPVLERIHRVGRRTVSLCSLDAYVDCPTREQRAWTGDSVVHQMVDLTTNDDWSLARWHPQLAASPRADGMLPMAVAGDLEHDGTAIIPDWSLHWIHSVWNLHRYTGDTELVASLLPAAEGVLRWFLPYLDEGGRPVDLPGWVIVDWASIDSDGASSVIAGLWGRALLEFAEMADRLGDAGRAGWARRCHERLVAASEIWWDDRRACYVDTAVGGRRRPMVSQHAQAAMVVGRLAPVDRWGRLVEVMLDRSRHVHATFSVPDGPAGPGSESPLGGPYLMRGHPEPWWDVESGVVVAQPFFRYVVHDAVVDAGRGDLLVGLLRDWAVLLERCPTSWSETWFGGTICHGWSSTPTRDLVQRVAGITPFEPGCRSMRIAPHPGGLTRLRASAPTPFGPVEVDLDIEVPGDTMPGDGTTGDGTAGGGRLRVTSPVPVEVDLIGLARGFDGPGGSNTMRRLPAGRHELAIP